MKKWVVPFKPLNVHTETRNKYAEDIVQILCLCVDLEDMCVQAAMAAKKARELVRRKNVLKSSTLPGKLSDCSCTDPRNSGWCLTFTLRLFSGYYPEETSRKYLELSSPKGDL